MNWTPDALGRLEAAIAEGTRVHLRRRGAEIVVLPRAIRDDYGGERLRARHLGTGDEIEIPLDEVEAFRVLD